MARKIREVEPTSELAVYLAKYLEWMMVKNYSKETVWHHRFGGVKFIEWAERRGLSKPSEVTHSTLERFSRYLFYYRKANGDPLATSSQETRLSALRSFFGWLTKQRHLPSNPATDLELPRPVRQLPQVLTISEVETVLNQPNANTDLGIRDRAILETLYSTGVRRSELVHLRTVDLNNDRGTVAIRRGKGKKDRVVPIGERAIAWVTKYLFDVRPTHAPDPDDRTLFLTSNGEPIDSDSLSKQVARYIDLADLGKHGSCHLLRHTMATLMLEGGADVRFVQEMLGHAKLETTQLYTQVSIVQLKRVHEATHPSAKLGRTVEGLATASTCTTPSKVW